MVEPRLPVPSGGGYIIRAVLGHLSRGKGVRERCHLTLGGVGDVGKDQRWREKAQSGGTHALGSRGGIINLWCQDWFLKKIKHMHILMVLNSHDQLGNTGKKTGFWLEEFAAPYYVFKDAGARITLTSLKGGQPKAYLKAMSEAVGDWIVYYEPVKAGRRGYFAVAQIDRIIDHPGSKAVTSL
ncbi:hypothetical protein J2X53_002040 [Pseudorhodobacter sp. 4114]|nr:hypothetical protein [Pseudorhodobacter sp. 4114]